MKGRPPPPDLRATRFRLGGEEFVVVSYGRPRFSRVRLTGAERSVLDGILAGRSNREIAAERGTSTRTVANQVASIFAKLHVGSRAELCVLCAGWSAK